MLCGLVIDMESGYDHLGTYGLITKLCEHLLENHSTEQHPYIPPDDNTHTLKKLRTKVYEILLNKSLETYHKYVEPKVDENNDPILELMKCAFVLKVGKKAASKANELQSLANELIQTGCDTDPLVISTLQLLLHLKNIEPQEEEKDTEIFYYGKANPHLPEPLWDRNGVEPFTIHPMESFILPKKFETMLGIKQQPVIEDYNVEPGSRLSFLGRFISSTTIGIESIRSGITSLSALSETSKGIVELAPPREYIMPSYFLPSIIESTEDMEVCESKEKQLREIESTWEYTIPLRTESSIQDEWQNLGFNAEPDQERVSLKYGSTSIWEDVVHTLPVPTHRTWDTLGQSDAAKEPNFFTETPDAMFHIRRIKQANILRSLSQNMLGSVHMIKEVTSAQFLSDVKLLLLGIESESFAYDNLIGFHLHPNVAIPGLSIEALKHISSCVTQWGNCFKALTLLTTPHEQTGKLQQEGLIFKAMCGSITDVLLSHQAVILRIPIAEESIRILRFIEKLRPLGLMITGLAKLCLCDSNNQSKLDEGLGILTHIYQEVTKVTKPNIALIFYSILKACCEVYFRFLETWLFEGAYEDIYGEFMIKIRPHYARQQGPKFWTKGFAINQNSVPGFLEELADSILQCGKAVRLLKICDPKNPLCVVSAASYPAVRVCLSVGQLREQQRHCNEYLAKVRAASGPKISLSTALQEEREVFKKKAERVNEAHQEILTKIRREHEESVKQIAQTKRELLAELRDQAEEAVLRKERNKEAELKADQLLMERITREQSEEAARVQHEKEKILKYYNELAVEADSRKIHADWRIRRMQLFDDRAAAIFKARDELSIAKAEEDIEDTPNDIQPRETNVETVVHVHSIVAIHSDPVSVIDSRVVDANANEQQDENSNVSQATGSDGAPELPNINIQLTGTLPENDGVESFKETSSVRSPRPTVLNVTPIKLLVEPAETKHDHIATEIPEQNTNKLTRRDENWQNFITDRTDIKQEALTNRLRNTASLAAFGELDTDRRVIDSNNAAIIDTLDLMKLTNTDNMTELQRNRIKVLQIEYNLTPNNNEINAIFPGERTELDNILMQSIQENRGSEIKSLTNQTVGESFNDNLTDMKRNRTRNMGDRIGQEKRSDLPEELVDVGHELTDMERNRNRNMSHSTDQGVALILEKNANVPVGKMTDLQKNRAKMMEQEFSVCGRPIVERSNDNVPPMSSSNSMQQIFCSTTPMSCTTDNFPLSRSSSTSMLQYCLNTPISDTGSCIPSALTTGEILTADTVRSDLTQSGFKFPNNAAMFSNFLGFGLAAMTPTSEESLTIEDVELIDNTSLHVYLEKSVMIPLQVQSRLVNDALVKYLLEEHKFLSHLHSLRSYFFLLNGEFAKNLTKSLFTRLYEVTVPVDLLNSATLNSLLDKALIASLSGSYANAERLSLSAVNVPSQLQVSSPEALECLSLNYKISWPLNIIFNEMVLFQYSRVFKFLLMVARVMWVLQEDFHILKVERKASNSQEYHRIHLYRYAMMQFITALHNYLTCSVLHASWAELEKDLETAITVDQLYFTHVGYIKKILSRCMLNSRGEKMRTCLHNIFKVILKFHNSIRSENWLRTTTGYTHPNFNKLQRMYEAFCELRNYMAHIADKLASSGYQPHLTHFLNSLNMNTLYDLTVRKKD